MKKKWERIVGYIQRERERVKFDTHTCMRNAICTYVHGKSIFTQLCEKEMKKKRRDMVILDTQGMQWWIYMYVYYMSEQYLHGI